MTVCPYGQCKAKKYVAQAGGDWEQHRAVWPPSSHPKSPATCSRPTSLLSWARVPQGRVSLGRSSQGRAGQRRLELLLRVELRPLARCSFPVGEALQQTGRGTPQPQ